MTHQILEIPVLPQRAPNTHKGNFGCILIIGGSRQMLGAPCLTAMAALRSGAGLVRIAVPESIQLTVAGAVLCATTIPLSESENGLISTNATGEILAAISDNNVIAIGPGLGQGPGPQLLIEKIVTECDKPRVIDADGLNMLAKLGSSHISQ